MIAARTVASLAAAALIASAAPGARADELQSFHSPTGNIGCVYAEGTLRCDVRDGIVPLPPAPASCQLDWGAGYWLNATGRARTVCAGDTALGEGPVLKYGSTWKHAGLTCSSASTGLTCTNAAGRGFFISRGAAHVI